MSDAYLAEELGQEYVVKVSSSLMESFSKKNMDEKKIRT